MDLVLIRTPGGLVPSSDHDADELRKIKAGTTVRCEITRMRNGQFHRKFFALLRTVFDLWTEYQKPMTYQGMPVEPSFDRFRRDFVILCGYYSLVVNIKGEVRVESKSISFASMDEATFADLYDKAIDVALRKVLPTGATDEKRLRESVEAIMEFA